MPAAAVQQSLHATRHYSAPYARPFSDQSRFERSRSMHHLFACLCALSGSQVEELLRHALRSSRLLSPVLTRASSSARPLLERFRRLHAWAPSGLRATILSLLVDQFSRQELVAAGFRFSCDQLRTARRLNEL